MDRSNFNPDQLHEHLDRIKENFGIELEDNGRMVRIPTGQRFVVGEAKHYIHDDPDKPTETHIDVHTEAGLMGSLWLRETGNKLTLRNEGNVGEKAHGEKAHGSGYVTYGNQLDENVPLAREMTFPHLNEPLIPEMAQGNWTISAPGSPFHVTLNPSSDTVDSYIEETMKYADRKTKPIPGPGVFQVHRNARPEIGTNAIPEVFLSMNRKSGRFERASD